MLARMGAAFNLAPQAPSSEERRILKDLHVARTALIKDRTRLRNRAQTQGIAVLKRKTNARPLRRNARSPSLTLRSPPSLHVVSPPHATAISSIPGSGKITVAAVLNFMPEIDGLERKQVACLAELAPITGQSGQWQAKVFILGGRKPLRDTLYMPALSQCGSTWILRQNKTNCVLLKNQRKSPSSRSCANLSRWRTP